MISTPASYAVFALSLLNGPDGDFKLVRDVSKQADIPTDFLQKILNRLRKLRIIIAKRGAGGGVKLAKNKEDISLLEVLTAMEEPVLESRCVLGLTECNDDAPCPSHNFWSSYKPLLISHWAETNLDKVTEAMKSKGMI